MRSHIEREFVDENTEIMTIDMNTGNLLKVYTLEENGILREHIYPTLCGKYINLSDDKRLNGFLISKKFLAKEIDLYKKDHSKYTIDEILDLVDKYSDLSLEEIEDPGDYNIKSYKSPFETMPELLEKLPYDEVRGNWTEEDFEKEYVARYKKQQEKLKKEGRNIPPTPSIPEWMAKFGKNRSSLNVTMKSLPLKFPSGKIDNTVFVTPEDFNNDLESYMEAYKNHLDRYELLSIENQRKKIRHTLTLQGMADEFEMSYFLKHGDSEPLTAKDIQKFLSYDFFETQPFDTKYDKGRKNFFQLVELVKMNYYLDKQSDKHVEEQMRRINGDELNDVEDSYMDENEQRIFEEMHSTYKNLDLSRPFYPEDEEKIVIKQSLYEQLIESQGLQEGSFYETGSIFPDGTKEMDIHLKGKMPKTLDGLVVEGSKEHLEMIRRKEEMLSIDGENLGTSRVTEEERRQFPIVASNSTWVEDVWEAIEENRPLTAEEVDHYNRVKVDTQDFMLGGTPGAPYNGRGPDDPPFRVPDAHLGKFEIRNGMLKEIDPEKLKNTGTITDNFHKINQGENDRIFLEKNPHSKWGSNLLNNKSNYQKPYSQIQFSNNNNNNIGVNTMNTMNNNVSQQHYAYGGAPGMSQQPMFGGYGYGQPYQQQPHMGMYGGNMYNQQPYNNMNMPYGMNPMGNTQYLEAFVNNSMASIKQHLNPQTFGNEVGNAMYNVTMSVAETTKQQLNIDIFDSEEKVTLFHKTLLDNMSRKETNDLLLKAIEEYRDQADFLKYNQLQMMKKMHYIQLLNMQYPPGTMPSEINELIGIAITDENMTITELRDKVGSYNLLHGLSSGNEEIVNNAIIRGTLNLDGVSSNTPQYELDPDTNRLVRKKKGFWRALKTTAINVGKIALVLCGVYLAKRIASHLTDGLAGLFTKKNKTEETVSGFVSGRSWLTKTGCHVNNGVVQEGQKLTLWEKFKNFFVKSKDVVVNFCSKAVEKTKKFFSKAWNWVKGLFSKKTKVTA